MFITFEGDDGSGKTTQTIRAANALIAAGHRVLLTREPGGTSIGTQIRAVLHDLANTAMHPRTELLLYTASRAQIVEELIKPTLAEGDLVVCDRFFDSTFAYQGYGHGLDLDWLHQLIEFATGGLRPDLTLFMDIDPQTALKRRIAGAAQGEEWNRMDALELAFHERVYVGYQQLIAAEPERWVRINANRPIQDIEIEVMQVILDRLSKG